MKYYWQFSLIVSWCMYLLISFVRWNIYWIEDVPKWTNDVRGGFVFVVIIVQALLLVIWFEAGLKDKLNKK